MKKDLIAWETKKLWSLPMIPIFLILCLAFNIMIVYGNRYEIEYIQYIGEITEEIGGQMGKGFDNSLSELPKAGYKNRLISESTGATDVFERYDTNQLANLYIDHYQISGTAASLLGRKYKKLQSSVDKLATHDASLSLCAAGKTKDLMEALFQRLCRAILTEGILLAVLMALYNCNCERLNCTVLTVYSTRTGRHIQYTKAVAGELSAIAAYAVIAVISTVIFALLWDIGPIWNANMSSQFNHVNAMGLKLPFITWSSFTVAEYLGATFALGAVVVMIFYGLGFAVGLLTRDTYKGFILIAILMALNFEVIITTGDSGNWLLYQLAQWTPVSLWWFQPLWFTDLGMGAILPWQECCIAVFCILLCGVFFAIANRYFHRKDVV